MREVTHIRTLRPTLLIAQGRVQRNEVKMATIARALSRAFITISEVEVLKQLVLFAAAGLFVSLLLLTYGVDLSPGFF
jgi:hypothetical protein